MSADATGCHRKGVEGATMSALVVPLVSGEAGKLLTSYKAQGGPHTKPLPAHSSTQVGKAWYKGQAYNTCPSALSPVKQQ